MDTIAERYSAVLQRVTQAAHRVERQPEEITVVAVSKTWPAEVVLQAYAAGIRHFGENRTEELESKRTAVSHTLGPDNGITWHLIGTLQSRKTQSAAEFADYFHALDRLKIANRLSHHLQENGRTLPIFLEVNVSGEISKSGFPCTAWETNATQQAELRKVVAEITQLSGLQLQGLMTMAPWDVPETEIRTVFRRTRAVKEWLETAVPTLHLPFLSMGMTDDFEIAIEEGATHVRVGRAIFGFRP